MQEGLYFGIGSCSRKRIRLANPVEGTRMTPPMAREPFYEIPKAAYLFGGGLSASENRDPHEESVRQWCAYELLRAYGIKITEMEFERPVKVGSKRYRIDIVVS